MASRNYLVEFVYRHRRACTLAAHVGLFTAAYGCSYLLRFDFDLPGAYLKVFLGTLPAVLVVEGLIFAYFSLYRGLWRYAGTADLVRIVSASGVSALVLFVVLHMWSPWGVVPRSVLLMNAVLAVVLIGGARLSVRVVREEFFPQLRSGDGAAHRVLIVGAGAAGEQAVREIRHNPRLELEVVGLIDDDERKRGGTIHGIPVLGSTDEIQTWVERHEIEEVLIAIPSATGRQLQRILDRCASTDLRFKVLPAAGDLIAGRVSVQQFREVEIEDLLGREPVELDLSQIGRQIGGKTVLITGAAGSIGSELARQAMGFEPRTLILLDRNESGLFYIHRELRERETGITRVVPVIGDIRDGALVERTLSRWKPSLVYHAAAYKHVPMMETSVVEAVRNNVLASHELMGAAERHGVGRFVLVSTDKAVRPRNVMGATKRLTEMLMVERNRDSRTHFIAVRFGNVLGSVGSVLPIFRRQLRSGGPLTVTHPEASRFFMTIPEAVQLVMQAGAMGAGGEIYILEMGEPMRVVELAERLITLAGKRPYEDVDIVFTGLRPGEKLHEELYSPEEALLPTEHSKILVLGPNGVVGRRLDRVLERLRRDTVTGEEGSLREALMEAVATRQPARRRA